MTGAQSQPSKNNSTNHSCELKHHLGSNFHLLDSPMLLKLLATLSHPTTTQPQINFLVSKLYEGIFSKIIDQEFPLAPFDEETRMATYHPKEARLTGEYLSYDEKIVCVALARAGIIPSQVCYELSNQQTHECILKILRHHFDLLQQVEKQYQLHTLFFLLHDFSIA